MNAPPPPPKPTPVTSREPSVLRKFDLLRRWAVRILIVLAYIGVGIVAREAWRTYTGRCPPNCISGQLVNRDLRPLPLLQFVPVVGDTISGRNAFQGIVMLRANLDGANLRDLDLRNTNLTGARLTDANLAGADLRGANLTAADLRDADLTAARLEGANLTGADLREATLTGVTLTDTTLTGVNFQDAVMNGVNLSGVNLSGVNLRRAFLLAANLEGANLSGATLSEAEMAGANLRNADLTGASINRNASLFGADLSGANLRGASIYASDLSANLNNAQLQGTILVATYLGGANLCGADLTGARTDSRNLNEARLIRDPAIAELSNNERDELASIPTTLVGVFYSVDQAGWRPTIWPGDFPIPPGAIADRCDIAAPLARPQEEEAATP